MSLEKWADNFEKKPVGTVAKLGFIIFGFVILISVIGFFLNPFKQAADIVNQTIDADNVIANYEWFKQRHEDIGAIDTKIIFQDALTKQFKTDAGPRTNWDRSDKEEYSRLTSILVGLKQQRSDLAAEYNARSRMTNRKIFKAGDVELPVKIPLAKEEEL